MDYLLGLDIGQSTDPSSFVLLGRTLVQAPAYTPSEAPLEEDATPDDYDYAVLRADVLPLGTPYQDVADYTLALTQHPRTRGRIACAADRTGVGRAVLETIRERPGLSDLVWGVTFSSGRAEKRDAHSPMDFSVPKKDLVGLIQIALQRRRLRWRLGLPNEALLKEQLLEFRHEVRPSGTTAFEAPGRLHDDLVMALGLALWLSGIVSYQGDAGPAVPDAGGVVLMKGLDPIARELPSWRRDRHDLHENLGPITGPF